MKRTLGMLTVVVAVLALLTACGGGESSDEHAAHGAGGGQGFNAADVQFATDMIPHHAQALSMVDLTVGQDLSPEVEALAEEIRIAQAPEIEEMAAWLEKWGKPIPDTSRDHAGHDMGGATDMPGMASMDDMTALQKATGPEFEQMFLTMMIEHHEGAIEMARSELDDGENVAAKNLAQDIITGQEREITTMQELLAK